jgi:Mlc titration factor MtfA (ptsG expression regulator)
LVLHEFAHQLDQEEGKTDGTPLLGRGMPPAESLGLYMSWARMLSEEYEKFRCSIKMGDETVMDPYCGSNKVEFFAVATECFFEKPRQLSKKYPELYAALRQFFKQDPATWSSDPQGA